MMYRQLRLAFCSKNETVNSTNGTVNRLTPLPLTDYNHQTQTQLEHDMTDKMTAEKVAQREAASEAASQKVTRIRAELRQAEHDAYNAHRDAVYAAQRLNYDTRKDKFENAARAAIEEAKLRCGMSAEYPNENLVQTISFDVPFRSHRGDAVLKIQPKDWGKRVRSYKQNKDGGFNVSAIAALFAESKPE